MNFGDENNPFADAAIRQSTSPQTNQSNPFATPTTPTRPVSPPSQPSTAAFLPPPPPPPPVYTPVPTPAPPVEQPTSTRVDLSDYEQRQADLEKREKLLAERERALTNLGAGPISDKNFPPFPSFCPFRPCFHQNISVDIPRGFQLWVRYLYYLWIIYSITLFLNMIAALSYFLIDIPGGATSFALSIVYLVLFMPLSYICWFRPIYRAFRTDSSVYFMIFFVIDIMFIGTSILAASGIMWGLCGLKLMIKLFESDGNKAIVRLLVMIVTFCFALFAIAGGLLMIKVHRLYRQTGASLEQAQKEFQTAFVNNSTVRGAAREVASAGINEALRNDDDHRPIY